MTESHSSPQGESIPAAELLPKVYAELRALAAPDSAAVRQLWDVIEAAGASVQETLDRARKTTREDVLPEQFLVLVECASEAEQTTLLQRFKAEGLNCKTLVS